MDITTAPAPASPALVVGLMAAGMPEAQLVDLETRGEGLVVRLAMAGAVYRVQVDRLEGAAA